MKVVMVIMGELSRSRVCYWDLCWRIDRNTTTDKRDSAPSNNRQDDTNENDQQSSPITVHNKRDYETDSESEDKPGKRRRSARIAARHGSSSNTWIQALGIQKYRGRKNPNWINQIRYQQPKLLLRSVEINISCILRSSFRIWYIICGWCFLCMTLKSLAGDRLTHAMRGNLHGTIHTIWTPRMIFSYT